MSRSNGNATKSRIPTAGEVLPNGVVLDLIRDKHTQELALLAWDKNHEAHVAGQVKFDGKTYIPATPDPTVLSAMQFPSHYESAGIPNDKLFFAIYSELSKYSGLPDQTLSLITYFVLATWLADFLPIAPFLWIVSPDAANGEALLQLLALFCRRSLLLAGDSASGLWTMPMHLQPTLLLGDLELNPSMERFLAASNKKGMRFAKGGRTLDFSCAKAVSCREALHDPALANHAIQITLRSHRCKFVVLTREARQTLADKYQSELLRYRLSNYDRIRLPDIDVELLERPRQMLARTLAACAVDNEGQRLTAVNLMREHDRENRPANSWGLEPVIVEALLSCCHDETRVSLRVAELTELVNSLLIKQREDLRVSPETVGWKLRALEFATQPIGSAGRGLWMLKDVRAQIHQVAREFELPPDPEGLDQGCPGCLELQEAIRLEDERWHALKSEC